LLLLVTTVLLSLSAHTACDCDVQAKQKPVVTEPNRKPTGYDTRYQRSPIDPCSSPIRLNTRCNSKTSLKQCVKESFSYGESHKLLRSVGTTNTAAAAATASAAGGSGSAIVASSTVDTTGEHRGDSDAESCPEDDLPGGIWDKVHHMYTLYILSHALLV
jgi:hypothetical protein